MNEYNKQVYSMKKINMKQIVFSCWILGSPLVSVAQSTTPAAPAQNNNAIQNNIETNSIENKGLFLDSVYLFENKSIQKKDKYSIAKQEEISSSQSFSAVIQAAGKLVQDIDHQRTQRTPEPENQVKLDLLVVQLKQMAPESFEYFYYDYLDANYDFSKINELLQAEKLRSEHAGLQEQLVAYYTITGNAEKSLVYLQKLVLTGELSQSSLQYTRDVLMSVAENGILLTHGVEDTYSALYLQESENFRSDVRIIDLEWLQNKQFREQLISQGIHVPAGSVVDVAFVKQFCLDNANQQVHLALTIPREYFEPIKQLLYVNGLTFYFSKNTGYDNFYRNNYLWNEQLTKSVLKMTDERSNELAANYLPMLLQLRKVYIQEKNQPKVKELDRQIDQIAIQIHKKESVQQIKNQQ